MPTILRVGPYRIFFYSADREEPRHVHVEHDKRVAKFWLDPVRIQKNNGFAERETRWIQQIIEDKETLLIEAWNDYFND